MYTCDFCRFVGVGRATCLSTRGLVRSLIRRIVPPLPPESSPSNTIHTFAPEDSTHSCIATSSPLETTHLLLVLLRFMLGRTETPSAWSSADGVVVLNPVYLVALLDLLLIGT